MTGTTFVIGFINGIAAAILIANLAATQKKKAEPIDLRHVIERIEAKQDQLRDLLAAHDENMLKACAAR